MKTENPLPALDTQLDLLRFWQSPDSTEAASTMQRMAEPTPPISTIRKIQIQTLSGADPYFVTGPICSLIMVGAESLPDLPIGDIDIPGVLGFVYLSKPSAGIGAFSWRKMSRKDEDPTGRKWEFGGPNPNAFLVTTYSSIPSGYWSLGSLTWDFLYGWGKGWQDSAENMTENMGDSMMEQRRFIQAYFTFLSQPLVMRSVAPIQRQARKRAAAAGLEAPLLRIVSLRHPVRQGTGKNQPREWNWQWIVKGHWRNQWYPSLQAHKLKWIESYVKGPEDKPLKRPNITIFNVVR